MSETRKIIKPANAPGSVGGGGESQAHPRPAPTTHTLIAEVIAREECGAPAPALGVAAHVSDPITIDGLSTVAVNLFSSGTTSTMSSYYLSCDDDRMNIESYVQRLTITPVGAPVRILIRNGLDYPRNVTIHWSE